MKSALMDQLIQRKLDKPSLKPGVPKISKSSFGLKTNPLKKSSKSYKF